MPVLPYLADCSGLLDTPGDQHNDGDEGQRLSRAPSTILSASGWINSLHPWKRRCVTGIIHSPIVQIKKLRHREPDYTLALDHRAWKRQVDLGACLFSQPGWPRGRPYLGSCTCPRPHLPLTSHSLSLPTSTAEQAALRREGSEGAHGHLDTLGCFRPRAVLF